MKKRPTVLALRTYSFKIDGPIWGYRQGRKEAFRPERVEYKRRGRLIANTQGVPDDLGREDLVRLSCWIFWKKRQRIDWKNVVGLVEDSLFKDDRRVFPGRHDITEHAGIECVSVILEVLRR